MAGDLLQSRIRRVLAIAAAYGYQALVLGAWGCGAFGNDPARTARDFHAALAGDFAGAFAAVVFAITDWSPERRFLAPFAAVFRPEASHPASKVAKAQGGNPASQVRSVSIDSISFSQR